MRVGRVNFKIGRSLDGKQPFTAAFSFIDSAQFQNVSQITISETRESDTNITIEDKIKHLFFIFLFLYI